jgi:hypothetical protein
MMIGEGGGLAALLLFTGVFWRAYRQCCRLKLFLSNARTL